MTSPRPLDLSQWDGSEMKMTTTTLLKLRAVVARTGVSRSRLYRLMADGRFPRPEPASIGVAKFWRADLVDQAIAKLAAKSGRKNSDVD